MPTPPTHLQQQILPGIYCIWHQLHRVQRTQRSMRQACNCFSSSILIKLPLSGL